MSRIMSYELKRGFLDKTLLLFLILVITVNMAGIYINELSEFEHGDNLSAVKKIDEKLMNMSYEDAAYYLNDRINISSILFELSIFDMGLGLEILKISPYHIKIRYPDYNIQFIMKNFDATEYSIYTNDIYYEVKFLKAKLKQLQQTYGYDEYVDSIIQNVKTISENPLFQSSEFSKRNNRKTLNDYMSLNVRDLKFNSSEGIICATTNKITGILSILVVMFICIRIFVKDKENNTIELLKTMKYGRAHLMTSKIVTLFLLIIATGTLLNLSSLFISYLVYGLGNLSYPVQSVAGFLSSTYEISVFQYIFIYNAFNTLTLVLIGFAMLFMFIAFSKSLYGYMGITAFFGLGIALYTSIDPVSSFAPFKYVNIYNYLNSSGIVSGYLNMNIFGYPVSLKDIFYVTISSGILLVAIACIGMFSKQKIGNKSKKAEKAVKHRHEKVKTGIFRYELYKSFIINPALLILVLMLVLVVFSKTGSKSGYADIDSLYYKHYMDILSGPVSPDKTEYLESEKERVEQEKLVTTDPNNTYDNQLNVINKLIEKDKRLNAVSDEKNKKLSFVYEPGYERLLQNNNETLLLSLITAVLITLCTVNVFAIEYRDNTYDITNVTKYGRHKSFRYKMCINAIMSVLTVFITYTPYVYRLTNNYPFENTDAPVMSMDSFTNIHINVSISGFMILTFLLKTIGLFIAAVLIGFLAVKIKSYIMTAAVSTFIIIVPSFLAFIGLRVFEKLLFNPLITGNTFLCEFSDIYPSMTVTLIICGTLFVWLYNDYNNPATTKKFFCDKYSRIKRMLVK